MSLTRRAKSSVLWTLAIAGLIALGVAPSALAAPILNYAIPGSHQAINHITPASSGGVWFVQNLTEQPENLASRLRVGRMSDGGSLEALSPEIPGKAGFTQLAAASDGGLWVLGVGNGEIAHISQDAATESIVTFPEPGLNEAIGEGVDGRAWVLRCAGKGLNEACNADAVTTAGVVSSYPIASLNYTSPPGESSASHLQPHVVPTAGGVWFGKTVHNKTEVVPGAAFVTYSGEVTAVTLPASSELLGSGAGEQVWWEHFEGSSVTLGQINRAGQTSDLHSRPASFEYPNTFADIPGRNGDLLWSDNTPWSTEQTGRVGVYPAGGGASEYVVPKFAVTVPLEPMMWSGACQFGNSLYEASNGAIWAVSGGHPNMLSVHAPSGAFSTFLPVSPVPRELGISSPVESTTGAIWLALTTLSGEAILARANPLEPPPGLPPYPGGLIGTQQPTTPTSPVVTTAAARAAMARALNGARIALNGLRHHRRAHVRVNYPTAGTVVLKLTTRHGRHTVVVATGRLARSRAGLGDVAVLLTRAGKSYLRHHRHVHASLVITLTTAAGTASRTVKLVI